MRDEVDGAIQPPSMNREPRSTVMMELLRCGCDLRAPEGATLTAVCTGCCKKRMVESAVAGLDRLRQSFIISRHGELIEMGSLIRATNLWGYGDLMRELGADPRPFLKSFEIPPGIEGQEEAFVPYEAVARSLEASAADLRCPDFGLRLSRWQGLDILGPIAVIARNAQTLQDGLEAIARYLYVHSPALRLAAVPRSADSDLQFTYEMVEPGMPYPPQSYELSMANAVRIVRLLGGPDARTGVVSFMHQQQGPDAAYRDALGCPVHFSQTWCGFEVPLKLADTPIDSADPETRRIATKYLESHYLPSTAALSERVAELGRRLLPPANAALRSSPINSPCTHGRYNDTWPLKPCDARTSLNGNAATKRRGTLPNRGCISAKSRACLAIPNRAHSTGRAGVGSGRHPGSTERN